MSTIIAGRFDALAETGAANSALRSAGFPADQIRSFFLSPAGHRARYAIGGDHTISPCAEASGMGARAIELGEGRIVEGDWRDVDPSARPHLLVPRVSHAGNG